jgi:predicted transcriptional regulator
MAHSLPTFDAARVISARLEAIGVSKNFFATLVGVSSGEISHYLSGKKNIGGARTIQFDAMVRSLENLTELFQPIGIRFSSAEQILRLIKCCEVSPEATTSIRLGLDNLTESGGLRDENESRG